MLRRVYHWPLTLALGYSLLLLGTNPALAQDDDSAPTLSADEAVEPTQEELDAVGGLPSHDQPILETAEPAPSHQSAPGAEKNETHEMPATDSFDQYISVRLGGGLSMISTPAFNDAFSVRDDSPSQSIYGFTADVAATDQQIQLGIGGNVGWVLLPSTEIGFNFDFGYAPLTGRAGVISVLVGPAVNIEVVDDIVLGAGLGHEAPPFRGDST